MLQSHSRLASPAGPSRKTPGRRAIHAALLALCIALGTPAALAGPLRDRLIERRAAQQSDGFAAEAGNSVGLKNVRIVRDVAYGQDERQRFDVYLPQTAVSGAPVILMVHGGAWALGDKASAAVFENKVAHWVSRGFILISTNYRLLPAATPLQQAADVAGALAVAQEKAAQWGGERTKFVLIGHSAGAHLVALLAASPSLARQAGAAPWLGTIALDSAAYDLPQIMAARHYRFYDQAFGSDPAYWRAASPIHALQGEARLNTMAPFLAVCSSRRPDRPCAQAQAFVARARQLGTPATLLEQALSHADINRQLGSQADYTTAVEAFMRTLDATLAERLDPDRRPTR